MGGSLAVYQLLLLSMALVVTADDLLLFLVAWEVMTLTSWALVVTDHALAPVRAAGLQYLVAGHLATAALVLLALSLASAGGTYQIAALAGEAPIPRGLLFALALVGFGTKAGIVPTHVWLPDAHPAAPSHVSALMSAVMITMGFYGLARFLPLLGVPPIWWAYVLLVLGAAGALGGVLFALAERDVKRSLAYSTVENAGIATLAIGLGLLGAALDAPLLAALGWAAALLHLWNHALAKATLFLGFGALAQGVGDRSLDAMGGMLARWRVVGTALVVACAAIASLPGLNVFTSEWLLLRGLLRGGVELAGAPRAALLAAVVALALTGGLALACFARLVGVGLLGSPRSAAAAAAVPPGPAIWMPMLALLAGCLGVAAAPAVVVGALGPAVAAIVPAADLGAAAETLRPLGLLLPLIAVATLAVAALRTVLARAAAPARSATWGCGYAAVTPSMQYTSASFAEPVTRVLQPVLRSEAGAHREGPALLALWPQRVRWTSRTVDRVLASVYQPLFAAVGWAGARLRAYYTPRVTTSLLYIVLAVLALLTLLFLPVVQV
jgi:formate hydrogenlyase subunit 3/multisubunit Na+/H+ antiporter MnhD subunit